MSIEIKEVTTRRHLRKFVNFPEKLYKDNPCYIPPLEFDQMDTLDPVKGPAQAFCKSKLYLAYKDGELVGRVAAIVNFKANEQWSHDEVRFGWYDFVDDEEVSKALMDKVEEFGRQHGMKSIVGPLGFTDFDPEGMLVDGFDREGTMALIYNHPYYNDHLAHMGFEKDADWIEYRIFLDKGLPERIVRLAKIVEQRTNVHVRPLTRKMIRKDHYVEKLFQLINDCYKDLYNYTVLPQEMAQKYAGFYLNLLPLDHVCMIENDKDEPVAFGITMPSLNNALRKSRGRLFPFGWWYLLRSIYFKHEDGLEMLLIGVRPDYQNTGINAMVFPPLMETAIKDGAKWAETNAILETNVKNQGHWNLFENECKKRRRSYKKAL